MDILFTHFTYKKGMLIVIFEWQNMREKSFFGESFYLRRLLLIIAFLLSGQDFNQFWCMWELNPKSLIQQLETLPVRLIGFQRERERERERVNKAHMRELLV